MARSSTWDLAGSAAWAARSDGPRATRDLRYALSPDGRTWPSDRVRRDRQPDRHPDAAHVLELPRSPERTAPRHGLRAGRPAAGRRRRRRIPRTGRPAPGAGPAPARPSRHALRAHLQRRRPADGDRERATGSVLVWTLRSGRPVGRRTSLDPRSGTCRSAPTGGRWRSRPAAGGRSSTWPRCGYARAAGSESVWTRAVHTGRALHRGRKREGLGAALVHRNVAADGRRSPDTPGGALESTSADGRTLATGSTDGTIRLFDMSTQQPLGAPLPGRPNRAVAAQFTPDGAYLFAITDKGARTAGTCARPHGRGTPAPSPAGRHPQPSGPTRSPGATTRPPARATASPAAS